jgi:hypothetical protein
LAKDPWILHCAAADKDAVNARLAPASHTVIDCGYIAVARHRNPDRLFDWRISSQFASPL